MFSTSWWTDSVALYGSTTVSETWKPNRHISWSEEQQAEIKTNMTYFLYLRRGNHAEGIHDTIRVFFPDFADEQGSHAGTCATTQGMCKLETLQAVTALSLLSHHIHD